MSNAKKYFIDLGSSTIKTHEYSDGKLKLIEEHSIYFKKEFTPETGISEGNKELLLEYFKELKAKYGLKMDNTYIYATGVFRNLTDEQRSSLVYIFNKEFDLYFNIISHGIENYYLEKAMEGDYNGKKVMIINMGGKTTEIVVFKDGKVVDRKNLNIGVSDLLIDFTGVNDKYSSVKIEEILKYVTDRIKGVKFDNDYDCAIFTGGELRFEKLTNIIYSKTSYLPTVFTIKWLPLQTL